MTMRSFHYSATALLLSTAAPALAGAPLVADAGATLAAAPATEGTDAPAADGADDQSLQDIVVTATKRETNLQKTPIAISVMSAEALDDRNIESMADLGDGSVPGLRVAPFESRQSALTVGIRGIVPLDANQPAREQGVGVYLDGVYLGRQQGLGAALLDIERIEVLKGPQGTLFGRNTEGGAVSIITKAPSGKFGFRGSAGVGNLGSYSASGHLDLPAMGPLSIKVDAALDYQGAITKNTLPGQFGWGYHDRKGVQVKARFRPVDSFTLDLSADRGNDKSTPYYSQLLNFNPNNYPVGPLTGTLPSGSIRPLPPIVKVVGDRIQRVADVGVPQQPSEDKTLGYAATARWNVSDAVELRSITAYREVSVDQWDNAGGAHRPPVFAPNGTFSRYSLSRLVQDQFSQEFQAVGRIADQLDYVVGAYYFEEDASEEAATPSSLRWNADGTNYSVLDPRTFPGSDPAVRSIDRGSRADSKSRALFGQATWTPPQAQQLHLTLGGRYTRDHKKGVLYLTNNAPSRCPLTSPTPQLCAFDQVTKRFNPQVTVAFDAAERVNLYAKYATGYRSGGASSRSITYREFGPEDVKSYEIGAKTELFDRRVRLNMAAYKMDRKGSQVDFSVVQPTPTGNRNTLETLNAPGITRIRGVEIDAVARVSDRLTLNAAYAYTYTKVPDTVNPFNGRLERVFIPFTPRNVVNAGMDYEVPAGFADGSIRLHLDANYNQATQSFAEFAVKNESSFIANGRIALSDLEVGNDRKLTVALWSRNLFDNQVLFRRDPSNSNPNPFTGSVSNVMGDYGNFAAPRTFGIELSVKM